MRIRPSSAGYFMEFQTNRARFFTRLTNHIFMGGFDAPLDLFGRELVKRIAGDDRIAPSIHLRIECGGTVSATDDSRLQIFVGQIEHSPILAERTSPRHDIFVFKSYFSSR